ncbi:unnamed protein product [Closterium sp. NIES-53]
MRRSKLFFVLLALSLLVSLALAPSCRANEIDAEDDADDDDVSDAAVSADVSPPGALATTSRSVAPSRMAPRLFRPYPAMPCSNNVRFLALPDPDLVNSIVSYLPASCLPASCLPCFQVS